MENIILSEKTPYKKWRPLQNFLNYEINAIGIIRDIINKHQLVQFNRQNGAFVKLTKNNKTKEYLLAELVIINFRGTFYTEGDGILFRDGDIYNCDIINLSSKPSVRNSVDSTSMNLKLCDVWKCAKKAESLIYRDTIKSKQFIDKYDVLRILRILEFKCFHCGDYLSPKSWELDHLIPVSKGGGNVLQNLVCSCKICNRIKGSLVIEQLIPHMKRMIINYENHNHC